MKNSDRKGLFVYILQNESHLKNALADGVSRRRKIFIILDEFSGLSLSALIPLHTNIEVLFLRNQFSASLQHGSRLRKLGRQFASQRNIKNQLQHYFRGKTIGTIVFFNDSALVKIIILILKKIGDGLITEFWIDTLVGHRKKTLTQRFWVFAESLSLWLGLVAITPTVFGTTKLADRVLVPHLASKVALIARGQSDQKFVIKLTPRIIQLVEASDNWVPASLTRILIVASAWEWHGRADVEQWQNEFFAEVARLSSVNPDVAVCIRFHPRQTNISPFLGGQVIGSGISDFETDLLEASHIVSLRSSALFDAFLLQKQCFVYEVGAPSVVSNEFIDSLPRLYSVHDIFALRNS